MNDSYITPSPLYSFNYKRVPRYFLYALGILLIWWVFSSIVILKTFDKSIAYLLSHAIEMIAFALILSICINFKKNKAIKKKASSYLLNNLTRVHDKKMSNTIDSLFLDGRDPYKEDILNLKKALIKEKINLNNSYLLDQSSEKLDESRKLQLNSLERNLAILEKIV